MSSNRSKAGFSQAGLNAVSEHLKSLAQDKDTQNYKNVKVLLVKSAAEVGLASFSHDNFRQLKHVFGSTYGYTVGQWSIPRDNSHEAMRKKVKDFIQEDNDDRSVLKIFYYHGHGGQDEFSYLTFQWSVTSSSRDPQDIC